MRCRACRLRLNHIGNAGAARLAEALAVNSTLQGLSCVLLCGQWYLCVVCACASECSRSWVRDSGESAGLTMRINNSSGVLGAVLVLPACSLGRNCFGDEARSKLAEALLANSTLQWL